MDPKSAFATRSPACMLAPRHPLLLEVLLCRPEFYFAEVSVAKLMRPDSRGGRMTKLEAAAGPSIRL